MSKGVLLNSKDVPVLRQMVNDHRRKRRGVPLTARKRWPVGGSGGGGAKTIRFQIVSSDPTCLTALCQIKAQTFSGIADGSTGGIVTVYDIAGCFFNEPNVELTGRMGFATYFSYGTDGGTIDSPICDAYLGARWEVHALCCNTVECNT